MAAALSSTSAQRDEISARALKLLAEAAADGAVEGKWQPGQQNVLVKGQLAHQGAVERWSLAAIFRLSLRYGATRTT